MIKEKYFGLLRSWCDKLIELQIKGEGEPGYLQGAMICPACKMIHGRIADNIYPLAYLYDETGEQKYLHSAELLFEWSKNMLADDGSYYNDAQNEWNGITVFFVIMLARTLIFHGNTLPDETRKKFEERLKINIGWIMENITDGFESNINYHAVTSEAMALCWQYFKEEKYRKTAEQRMNFCLPFINEEGFLTGESHPVRYHSPRGLRGIDIGYNLEESLPALYECAAILGKKAVKDMVAKCACVHRRFILPDGGMDNSFGSRNYKWTYWGSRTSDGYLAMFEKMGKRDGNFLPYKYYAFHIFDRCTSEGLLYGGMDLKAHGEYPCIHHTFCKAKAVAALLDGGITEWGESRKLPETDKIFHYKSLLCDQIFYKGFYAMVTANDVHYLPGGHISGGMISFLWHEVTGPLMAASMMKYSLYEVTNSQLSLTKSDFEKQSLRYEAKTDEGIFSSDLDTSACFVSERDKDGICVHVDGNLRNLEGKIPDGDMGYEFTYVFRENRMRIACKASVGGYLHVPVIAEDAQKTGEGEYLLTGKCGGYIRLKTKGKICRVKRIFNLVCGFYMFDFTIGKTEGGLQVEMEINDDAR